MAKNDKREKNQSTEIPHLPKIKLKSADETIGKLIYDLRNNQMDIPKFRELNRTILPEKETLKNKY